MAKEKVVNLDENIDLEALKAQLRAEIEAEKEAEIKALEDKIAKSEQAMEAQIREEEKTTLQQLKEMKKVWLEIPEDPNNPDDIVPIGFNGIIYAVPRGKAFEVPEVIADIWRESHEKTKAAQRRMREASNKELTIN